MNEELYEKILALMSIDGAYEDLTGEKYIDQSVFDAMLAKAGVEAPDKSVMTERLEKFMDELEIEINTY